MLVSQKLGGNRHVQRKAYIERDSNLVAENHGENTSLGIYRVDCSRGIGGFVGGVNWEGIDNHCYRTKWRMACSWDVPDMCLVHLRPMGSSQAGILYGPLPAWLRPVFNRFGFLYMFASALHGKKRYQADEFRRFLRRYQWRPLIARKQPATAEIDGWNRLES